MEKSGAFSFYTRLPLEDTIIKDPFFHFCYRKIPRIQSIVCDTLWRRRLFTEKKIYFPTHTFYEDTITVPLLLKEINTLVMIPHYLYFYLMDRNTSIMNQSVSKILLNILPAFTRCIMKNKKKFSQENHEIQKAYEYFVEDSSRSRYNALAAGVFAEEHFACKHL